MSFHDDVVSIPGQNSPDDYPMSNVSGGVYLNEVGNAVVNSGEEVLFPLSDGVSSGSAEGDPVASPHVDPAAGPVVSVLAAAVELGAIWASLVEKAGIPAGHSWTPDAVLRVVSEAGLSAVIDSVGELQRQIGGLSALVAGALVERSDPELGGEGLSRKWGCRGPEQVLASAWAITAGEARQVVTVGAATQTRVSVTGGELPPDCEYVADALRAGTVTLTQADVIVHAVRQIRGMPSELFAAERFLVDKAPGVDLNGLKRLAVEVRDHIDPDGAEPRCERQRERRSLRIVQGRDGMTRIEWALPPEDAAIVVTGIDSIVTSHFRNPHTTTLGHTGTGSANTAGAGGAGAGVAGFGDSWTSDTGFTGPRSTVSAFGITGDNAAITDPNTGTGISVAGSDGALDPAGSDVAGVDGAGVFDPVLRTEVDAPSLAQLRSDAAVAVFAHTADCENRDRVGTPWQIVVRMTLNELRTNLIGRAVTLDGITDTIPADEARRIACTAGIIPAVLGGESEILDVGRSRRYFDGGLRTALAERDRGCAWPGCTAPPSYCDAHHVEWWIRDRGPTSLDNGVLLCRRHHRLIHTGDWEIQPHPDNEHELQLLPPYSLDPLRKPRNLTPPRVPKSL